MADQLVTPSELASFLQLTYADLTPAQQTAMTMLVQLSTGKIQAAEQWRAPRPARRSALSFQVSAL